MLLPKKRCVLAVMAMNSFFLGLLGLFCAVLWLVLLVVTSFNIVTISAGLLVGLYVTGVSSSDTTRRVH